MTPPSVYAEAYREAERHKWIESQKHGRDLGDSAIRDWYRRHWRFFCRYCCMEHLEGRRRWREFGDERFGQLFTMLVAEDLLADRVLDRVYVGYENLNIITWAIDWGLPVKRVVQVLSQVDVNRYRLDPSGAE